MTDPVSVGRTPIWQDGETGGELPDCSVLSLIDQQPPFVFIDQLTRYDPIGLRIETSTQVRPDPFWIDGHFPRQPVYPGVFLLEQMAQTALCLLRATGVGEGGQARLVGLDKMEFLQPCIPDDRLVTSARVMEDGLLTLCHGQVHRDHTLVCQGLFKVMG
ncbi:3-hydroxyacyl-ACP dehydratase FabZ family protein [Aestuariispira insulae]|uniref:3-hydroxyacyl-[acyl-carrier-protein] dehydratase n=1 Tax=Aestuariispira insulae TaxID=1461337 RepID=A0A3D9HUX7_9PROT|nr:FabA/FabZ family ACP-dehydratase [Aestuariispira insulae]RED53225.1 3-hydroxyacyl-[acyl-carrier-protein] dehydratase [Aestuariispira insulae]